MVKAIRIKNTNANTNLLIAGFTIMSAFDHEFTRVTSINGTSLSVTYSDMKAGSTFVISDN